MAHLSAVTGIRPYYLAATSARVSDEMVGVAVVLMVLDRTGSAPLAGAVIAAYLVPTLVSGPVLGAWLDRTRFRRAALATNQGLLAMVMLALTVAVGSAPTWVILTLAATVGVTVPMTSGGFTSLLPRFVPSRLLSRAHALEGVSFNVSAILGPACAATVAAGVSPTAAVATIVAFSVISLAALPGVPCSAAPKASAQPHQPGMATAIRAGLTHIARTPELRSVTLATTVAFVGFGMLTVTIPLHAEALTGNAAHGGYIWTAIELGAIVTALLWGRWHARWQPEKIVLASMIGFGLVVLIWPVPGSFALLLGLATFAGLASGAGMPALFTTRQRYTPTQLYGQISTTGASLKLGAFALGSAIGGQLVQAAGPEVLLVAVASLQLIGACVGSLAGRARHPRAFAGASASFNSRLS